MHVTKLFAVATVALLVAPTAGSSDASAFVQSTLRSASSRLAPSEEQNSVLELHSQIRKARAELRGLYMTSSAVANFYRSSSAQQELRQRQSDVVVLKEELAAKDARLRSLNVDIDPAVNEMLATEPSAGPGGDLAAQLEASKHEVEILRKEMAEMLASYTDKGEADTVKEIAATNTHIASLETELDTRDSLIRKATSEASSTDKKSAPAVDATESKKAAPAVDSKKAAPAVVDSKKSTPSIASASKLQEVDKALVDNFFQGSYEEGDARRSSTSDSDLEVLAGTPEAAQMLAEGTWSYKDAAEWGETFQGCSGSEQSPIDLEFEAKADDLQEAEQLQFDLSPLSMIPIVNNERTMQVEGPFGVLHLHSGTYTVEQFHFHFPSEHTVNGRPAAGELHIAFHREQFRGPKDLVVVAVLLEVPAKKPDPPPPVPQLRFEMSVDGLPEGLIKSQKRVLTDAIANMVRSEIATVAPIRFVVVSDVDVLLEGNALNVTYSMPKLAMEKKDAWQGVIDRLNTSLFEEALTSAAGIAGFGKTSLRTTGGIRMALKEFTVPEPVQPTAEVSDFFENIGFEPLGLSPLPGSLQYKLITDSVDLNAFNPQLRGHYLRYRGSLTTPPCSQGVRWIVLTTPAIIPANVVQTFNAYFPRPKNNRPVQALNGRVVRMDGGGVDDSEPLAIRQELRAQAYEGKHAWYYTDFDKWEQRYPECGGDRQSPIDIGVDINQSEPLTEAQWLKAEYVPKERRLIVNNGHSLQVDGQFGEVVMPDGSYDAKQFHFHFPSEHSINGEVFAGEMHIVHQRRGSVGANDLLTIAVLLTPENQNHTWENDTVDRKVAEPTREFFANLGFQPLMPRALPREGFAHQVFGAVDLNAFSDHLKGRFTCYWGSLTTPPCSETVKWMVFNEPLVVPNALVQHFKVAFPDAIARPLQGLNDRLLKDTCHTGPHVDM